jgi:DNA-binding LacI/PurR family transcriptional regulator
LWCLGVSVPDWISIVGFDDMPESRFSRPPLTTVRQDFEQLGGQLMALLLEQLGGAAPKRRDPIEPILVVRDSVCTPATARARGV